MKQIWLLFLLVLYGNPSAFAQTVTNIRFEQAGKLIDVYYDLSGKGNESFQVKLYCSLDGGKTWGTPLNYVTGDVGEKIKQGTNKKITWDVLKEKDKLVGDIKFKVETTSMSGCHSFTITHSAGSTAPVTKTVAYSVVETDLTGSKKCWITQNLGADRQATSATDDSEASAGWYWQFNRKQGFKHDGTNSTPNTKWISSISENINWLPANDPCTLLLGRGWRLPSGTEWETADATDGWDNYNETFSSILKLNAAGGIYCSGGSLITRGSTGLYWSSSQGGLDSGRCLHFTSGYSNMGINSKANGFTTRCLRD
jgi:hypothetical protein